MKRKYKFLIMGKNTALIDEFFAQRSMQVECLSMSGRMEDVKGHLQYFEPDVLVICPEAETNQDINGIKMVRVMAQQARVPYVIVGSKPECNNFQKLAYNMVDLAIVKTIPMAGIQDKIMNFVDEYQEKRQGTNVRRQDMGGDSATIKQSAQTPASAMDLLHEIEGRMSAPYRKGKKGHILVVDDDPRMLKVIRNYLRDEYEVAAAVNGKLALNFLERKKTDLILLDYEMPEMKGPEIYKLLKKDPNLDEIPVVFLTGVGELEKVQEVLAMRPQGYLLKPVDRLKLFTCVQQLIH